MRTTNYRGWTREEVDLVKSLMEKHEKVANIARHLSRPYQSVSLKVKEINSGEVKIKRYWKLEELKMLKTLLLKRISVTQIANIMGRNEFSIRNKLTKMGTDIWNESAYHSYIC